MRKRRFRVGNKVIPRLPKKPYVMKESAWFKCFLDWYEIHKGGFKFKLIPHSTNHMLIEGVNPLIQFYGSDFEFEISMVWKNAYDQLYFTNASVDQVEHGFVNLMIMRNYRTTYFDEQSLLENELFEPIKNFINNRLEKLKWASAYENGINFGEEKSIRTDILSHFPIWVS